MKRRKNLSVCNTTFNSVPELTGFVGLYIVEGRFLSRGDEPTGKLNQATPALSPRTLFLNPKGWQKVAGGRSDSGDLRRRHESPGTPKAVPERT
jgi:hypothetical protein